MSSEPATQSSSSSTQLSVLCPGPCPSSAPARPQAALWALTIVLAVLATAVVTRWDQSRWVPSAAAQITGSGLPVGGGRGIYAFTGQLNSKSYGLFMMDVDSGTIWCYEMQRGASGEPQMKLVAARSWVYDRYLEEFNAADPIPSAVKNLVQQQRTGQAGAATLPAGGERK